MEEPLTLSGRPIRCFGPKKKDEGGAEEKAEEQKDEARFTILLQTFHSLLFPPDLRTGSNHLLQVLGVHWRWPKSGGSWYKSRQLKRTICSRSEGWWTVKRISAHCA